MLSVVVVHAMLENTTIKIRKWVEIFIVTPVEYFIVGEHIKF